ncbi:unnamed protein product [Rotaria socialis]|uniref:Uncharacterized protein n=1 Tax=Rotaria socialis TaxID=392032 RepID=A0A821W8U6_9BILA|nr:unnamed protein product [Rotaria socialis]
MVLEQESFFNDYVSFTKQCVIERKDVEQFYEKAFEKTQLGVPHNHINGRLQYPSHLCGLTIEILGIGEEEAAGDIALSSAEEFFTLNSFINKKKQYRITNVYLIATGGDYIEGSYYRQA